MSERVSCRCILATAFIALSACAHAQAAPAVAFEQPAEAGPSAAGLAAPDGAGSSGPAKASNALANTQHPAPAAFDRARCETLEGAAAVEGLPIGFFTRLIRQESNFNPHAVSRKGAEGIAQFMPGTARWRGLSDPFEPAEALMQSARWLRELRDEFGNLGLAAAAYNAGPQRVRRWLAGRGSLPNETRAYVRIITGRSAEEWRGVRETPPDPPRETCAQAARLAAAPDHSSRTTNADLAPWGLQLIGDLSESRALSAYAELQKRYRSVLSDRAPIILRKPLGGRGPSTWYLVRVAESTHERATQLCSRLKSAGGSCIVTRN
jgi:transglycosylase-like protein with SLT domain